MWDELAAASWLDPSVITAEVRLYMDIDIRMGRTTGMSWSGLPVRSRV